VHKFVIRFKIILVLKSVRENWDDKFEIRLNLYLYNEDKIIAGT